jgi:hypothetical protein
VNELYFTKCKAESNGTIFGLTPVDPTYYDNFHFSGFNLNGLNMTFEFCQSVNNKGNGFRFFGTNLLKGGSIVLIQCKANYNHNHGVTISNSTGVLTDNPNNLTFLSCEANNNGDNGVYSGFAIHSSDYVKLTDCRANSNKEHGFVLMDLVRATINACYGSKNERAGLRIQSDFSRVEDSLSGVKDSVITGCTFDENGLLVASDTSCGISITGINERVLITGNNIINNARSIAITKKSGVTDPNLLTFENNTMFGNIQGDDVYHNITAYIPTTFKGNNTVNGVRKPVVIKNGLSETVTYSDLTVNSGDTIITLPPTSTFFAIRPASAGLTLIIDHINGEWEGRKIIVAFYHTAATNITIKKNIGNINIGADWVVTPNDLAEFIYYAGYWRCISKQAL